METGPKPELKREITPELREKISEIFINEDIPESEGGKPLSYKTIEEAKEAVKYFNDFLEANLAFVGKDREGLQKPFKVMFDIPQLGAGFEKLDR